MLNWITNYKLPPQAAGEIRSAIGGAACRLEKACSRDQLFVERLSRVACCRDWCGGWRIIARRGEIVPSEAIFQARASIEELLNIYSDIYSIVTATKCRMSIKLIDFSGISFLSVDNKDIEKSIHVFTLARDSSSTRENQNADLKREEEKLDPLIKNTDFLSLWDMGRDDTGFFHSPDLRAEKDYESSSLTFWRTKQENPGSVAIKDWPLPYRSTIVWPIRQEPRAELGLAEYDTVGFLAVDSPMPRAFDIGTNAPIGTILANGLHPILKLYNELDIVLKRQAQGRKSS